MITEEEILESELTFLSILEDFVEENYEVDVDYELTEEDFATLLAIKEYFMENFRVPTPSECLLEDVTSYDINTNFYEEFGHIMLDESIGKAVAGAMYHVKPLVSRIHADRARAAFQKAKTAHEKIQQVQQSQSKTTATSAFHKAKAARIQKRVEAAKTARDKALKTQRAAIAKHGQTTGRKEAMSKTIDAKVKSTKEGIIKKAGELRDKAKSAIKSGKERVAGFFGDVAGRLA